MFEPFAQTEAGVRKGGAGLGLSISRKILELMGGTLRLDSEVGKGSCFCFEVTLPAGAGGQAGVSEDRWLRVRRLKEGYRVSALIADDVAENREVLSALLRDIGVEVDLTEDGQEAVKKILTGQYDIALLDIRMPGMGGLEAARKVWDERGKTALKFVAISASTLDHERQGYLDAGFDDFIPKPFRAQQLYACLSDLLRVEYEYDQPVGPAEQPPLDLEGVSLPEPLFLRLKEAAELSNVTELERTLNEVEKIGPEQNRLASHLRALSQDFKMEEILSILEQLAK